MCRRFLWQLHIKGFFVKIFNVKNREKHLYQWIIIQVTDIQKFTNDCLLITDECIAKQFLHTCNVSKNRSINYIFFLYNNVQKKFMDAPAYWYYEITAKSKVDCFHNLTAGGIIEKYERERDEPRYCFVRMFLGRLWHWISFEAYFRLIHVHTCALPNPAVNSRLTHPKSAGNTTGRL